MPGFDQSRTDPTGIDRIPPAIAVGAGLGTTPPAPTIDPQADDSQGVISFGSGTTPVAGTILTVTWNRPKDPNRLPKVLVETANLATTGVDLGVGTITSTSFTIVQNVRNVAASQPSGTYAVTYKCFD